jgi:hypothetical protein
METTSSRAELARKRQHVELSDGQYAISLWQFHLHGSSPSTICRLGPVRKSLGESLPVSIRFSVAPAFGFCFYTNIRRTQKNGAV